MFSCLAPSAKGSKRFVDALAAELWDRRSGSAGQSLRRSTSTKTRDFYLLNILEGIGPTL